MAMDGKTITSVDDGSPLNLLQDALSPHSHQNPPPGPGLPTFPSSGSSSDSDDLSILPPQEAADRLFRGSEILAPMVRASTTPLRALALSHGADLVYTEELVDRSILPAERIVNEELGTVDYRVPRHTFSPKVQKRMAADRNNPDSKDGATLLRIDPVVEKNKIIYQVGTGEANLALEATTKVIKDVNGIDINMGCPKKFSVSGGMGSALLGDVKRACDIISTLRRNLPKPVSAKIRLLHPENPRPTVDFVRALVRAGANAITIHGRIVGDESHANARWKTLVEVVTLLKQTETVPIIVNGDLYTRADIREMKHRTGCDGVMLARPALYNVSLFRKGEGENGDPDLNIDPEHGQIPLPQFQTTYHSGYYGYCSPLLHSRTKIVQEYLAHCVRYRAHSKNAKYVVCEMMNSRRAPSNRVPFLNMSFEGGQTIQNMCKCRSLDDMVKLWDVKLSIPLPREVGNGINGITSFKKAETSKDLHNYDDQFFLDPDKFRNKRAAARPAAQNSGLIKEGDEKKTDDENRPETKRGKC